MAEPGLKQLLNDIRVELHDEFDQNFERKAFFDRPWPDTKWKNNRGSLMLRTGRLRRSLRSQVAGNRIVFSSSAPYAELLNNGGTVKVTARMKRFLWAIYYQAGGKVTYSVKAKKAANTARNRRLSDEAATWKALALKKEGDVLKFSPRPFIGSHPRVDEAVRRAADQYFEQVAQSIYNTLKR